MSNPDPKPMKPFYAGLRDFFYMAKGRPQSLIIHYFVEQIIQHSDICEQGSVLLHNPGDGPGGIGELVVTGTGKNENSAATSIQGALRLRADHSLAGLAFRKGVPEYTDDATKHPQFDPVEDQNIGPMYSAPILMKYRARPFGIVSFHDTEGKPPISVERQTQMDVAVRALEAMLELSPRKIAPRDYVFIVHGRDQQLLAELQKILRDEDIEPVVVQALARTGQDLLDFLEQKIHDCVAGFVLLTPDDEGRLYRFGEPYCQRARQNVIFEGGYLTALFRDTKRVCFLQHGDLEIPSDLHGLLMERFDEQIDAERIRVTLKEWGMELRSDKEQRVQNGHKMAAVTGAAAERPENGHG